MFSPDSERSGTPATRLPFSVPQHVRVERARKLTQLSLNRQVEHHRSVLKSCQATGSVLDSVLIEKTGEATWTAGYTPHYLRVLVPASTPVQQNQLVTVEPLDIMVDSRNSDVALISRVVPTDS